MHHHHDHGHSHACHHGHRSALLIGIVLNGVFVVAEILYGIHANSLALLADAGHNASDVLALLLALAASLLAQRRPSKRFTYGLQGSSILAALINATLLLVAVGGIGWEAIQRFAAPEPAANSTVIAVAAVGVVINGLSAWLFMGGRHDLNIRAAYLHMLADAGLSLGVVLSATLAMLTGWLWLDPLTGILISAAIIATTTGLLRESIGMALQGVPRSIDLEKVRSFLANKDGVHEVHDLHIWATSTTDTALSTHLLMPGGHPGDAFLHHLSHELKEHFAIGHATIQIEVGISADGCHLAHHVCMESV